MKDIVKVFLFAGFFVTSTAFADVVATCKCTMTCSLPDYCRPLGATVPAPDVTGVGKSASEAREEAEVSCSVGKPFGVWGNLGSCKFEKF